MRGLRKTFLAILGAFVLIYTAPIASGIAADMDEPSGPTNWTGAYGGVHFGGVFGSADYDLDLIAGPGGPYQNQNINTDGVMGGVLLGYNIQSNNFVYGLEIDASLGGVEGSEFFAGPGVTVQYDVSTAASLRARLGWAMDNTLFFVTGGGTLANVDIKTAPVPTASDEDTHYGFIVGAGIEHKFSEMLGLRVEYLYSHYFNERHTLGTFNDQSDFDLHTIRAAVVIHLGEVFGPN